MDRAPRRDSVRLPLARSAFGGRNDFAALAVAKDWRVRAPDHRALLVRVEKPRAKDAAISASETQLRPNGDGSKNLRLALPNPAKRPEPPPPQPPELPRIVRVLELARRWQAILDRGEARTREDLARLTGLGSRYVGNILELLRLHPSILEAIECLPVGAGNNVTERWLRPIARLPHDEQLTAVAERLDLGIKEDCG